jgi:hypothetical protein
MTKIAITVLAAITLVGSMVSVASGEPLNSGSKPNSFAPQHHSNNHIYGAPIERPIVGHAKASHHNQVQKRQSTSPKISDAQKAHVRSG